MPNVPAANGIIHVINAAVLPFAPTIDPGGCQ